MRQFNPYNFYIYATTIHPLTELNTTAPIALKDVVWVLWTAKAQIEVILQGPVPLPVSAGAASTLYSAIDKVLPEDFSKADMDRQLTWELYPIKNEATKFEAVFSAELQNANTYSVSQKGIYSTPDLIERAENALGAAVAIISDAAKADFSAAGRCLAFALPTACGFHTMRATESVLRQYHRLLLGLPASSKSPEMATCIEQLAKAGENPKLMESLHHIRGLHRNPLMHPEDFLSLHEALQLFDIAKSAITSMAVRISEINADPNLIASAKATYAATPRKRKGKP